MGDVSYVEAVYFIYVTISTIGFGDFVIRFEQHADYNRVVGGINDFNGNFNVLILFVILLTNLPLRN